MIKKKRQQNGRFSNSNQIKVKVSNPSRNISPIEVPMEIIKQEEDRAIKFQGELTFGFSGEWLIEIEAQRTENVNESKLLNLLVKPNACLPIWDIRLSTQYMTSNYQSLLKLLC